MLLKIFLFELPNYGYSKHTEKYVYFVNYFKTKHGSIFSTSGFLFCSGTSFIINNSNLRKMTMMMDETDTLCSLLRDYIYRAEKSKIMFGPVH